MVLGTHTMDVFEGKFRMHIGPHLCGWTRVVLLMATLALALAAPWSCRAQQVRLDAKGVVGIASISGPDGTALRTVRLTDPGAPLGKYALLLHEKPDAPLTLAQARQRLAGGAFHRSHMAVPNLGNDAPPCWLYLDIDDARAATHIYRMYLAQAWADRVDAWLIGPDGHISHWRVGDERSPAQDLRPGLGFAVDARLAPGRNQLFLRADSIDSVQLGVRLVPLAHTARLEASAQDWQGLVHGYLLALILTFGLLWLSLRDTSLLRYVAYVAGYLCMHLAYSGIGAQWLWPHAPGVARYAILVGMTLYSSAGIWFARDFLRLAAWLPRIDRACAWLVRIALLTMALCVVANAQATAVTVAFAYINIFTVLMVVLGILGVRNHSAQARPFLLASLMSMIGAFITTQAVMGNLPFNDWTFRIIEIGIMLEASIWALALGLRLRRNQRDHVQALELAQRDTLTGLYNRRGFLGRAQPAFADAPRGAEPHAVMMLDLDYFKTINDRHGHYTGDRTLVAVADRLRTLTRSKDIIARWGGEEFVVLLPETPAAQALAIAERLRASLAAKPVTLASEMPIRVTASVGVAHVTSPTNLMELLRKADGALYKAKQDGRNRVEMHGSETPGHDTEPAQSHPPEDQDAAPGAIPES